MTLFQHCSSYNRSISLCFTKAKLTKSLVFSQVTMLLQKDWTVVLVTVPHDNVTEVL